MTSPRNDSSPLVRASRDPMSWLGRHELVALLLVLVATAGTWLFATIADRVVADETSSFDQRVLLSMRNPDDHTDPIGPAWVEELGRDFTALGGTGVLTLIALATVGFLLLQGKRRVVLLVVVAVVGGLILSSVLKHLFDRPRPDLVPHGSAIYTASFPSGHSMMSAVTYLTLGALLARVQSRKRLKAYLLCLAVLLTFLVGVSRVYLGVHWPTDVLAGWMLGTVWAIIAWLVAYWLQSRGQVESDAE